MKNVLLLTLIIGLMGCRQTPENRAKKLIKNYIELNANDPSSYEIVDYGALDTQYSFYANENSYILLNDMYEKDLISFDEFYNKRDSISSNYKSEPIGLMMRHKFRSTNGFGAKVLSSKVFRFNLTLDSLTSHDDTLD